MLDQILDNYRKAVESTIQLQQEMLKRWTQNWPGMPGSLAAPAAGTGQLGDTQKKLTEALTDMLNKHRETLDAQYRTGIKTIEDAFRLSEAKDPAQYRKLVEELWRQSIECLTTVAEAQINNVRSAMEKSFELAPKGVTAGSKKG